MDTEHLFPRAFNGRFGQRQMDSHLIAIEVRVKGGANQRMDLNGGAVN
jgi:hypothetical protein